ncbi:hypothetical protein BH23ACT6_BH23ACT6_22450 [soil metagenome]
MSPSRLSGVGLRRSAPPLDRGRIVQTALCCVDAEGLHALTMRHLGELLGVEGMAIYRHFPGRAHLLAQMRVELLASVRRQVDWRPDSYQDVVLSVAREMRASWNAHPAMIPVLASYDPRQPWLRPPVANVALVENLLVALRRTGFTDSQAVAAYKALSAHLLGAMFAAHTAVGFDTDLRALLPRLEAPLAQQSDAR